MFLPPAMKLQVGNIFSHVCLCNGGRGACNHYLPLVSHRSYRILPDMFKLFRLGTPDPPIPPWPALLTHMGTTQPQPLPPDILKLFTQDSLLACGPLAFDGSTFWIFFLMRSSLFYQNVYATFNLFP